MFYVLIPSIEIQAANAISNAMLINAAPIMAVTMFGHSLGLPERLGQFPNGVAMIHHDAQMLGEEFFGRLYPQQRRAATYIDKNDYVQSSLNLSIQPTATCHLKISLVLRFESEVVVHQIESILASAKIAGGTVIRHGEIKCSSSLEEILNHAKSGFWVVNRNDLMSKDDPMSSFIDAVGRMPQKNEMPIASDDPFEDETVDQSNSWLVPATLGYALTTSIEKRGNARQGYEHAFAEPMMGIVQYRSVRDKSVPIPFWTHGWLSDDVFVVQ